MAFKDPWDDDTGKIPAENDKDRDGRPDDGGNIQPDTDDANDDNGADGDDDKDDNQGSGTKSGTAGSSSKSGSSGSNSLTDLIRSGLTAPGAAGSSSSKSADPSKAAKISAESAQKIAAMQIDWDREKFGKTFPLDEAQVMGTYNGQPTMAYQKLVADLTGTFQGQDTLAKTDLYWGNYLKQSGLSGFMYDKDGKLMINPATGQPMTTEEARHNQASEALQGRQIDISEGELLGWYKGQMTEPARHNRVVEGFQEGELTGFYQGQLTEAARAEREKERQTLAQITGFINGNLTDEALKWRTSAAMDYTKTAAELMSNPNKFFEAAEYLRGGQNINGMPTFLKELQQIGKGNYAGQQGGPGFNPMGANLPQNWTIDDLIGGMQGGQQQGGGTPGAQPGTGTFDEFLQWYLSQQGQTPGQQPANWLDPNAGGQTPVGGAPPVAGGTTGSAQTPQSMIEGINSREWQAILADPFTVWNTPPPAGAVSQTYAPQGGVMQANDPSAWAQAAQQGLGFTPANMPTPDQIRKGIAAGWRGALTAANGDKLVFDASGNMVNESTGQVVGSWANGMTPDTINSWYQGKPTAGGAAPAASPFLQPGQVDAARGYTGAVNTNTGSNFSDPTARAMAYNNLTPDQWLALPPERRNQLKQPFMGGTAPPAPSGPGLNVSNVAAPSANPNIIAPSPHPLSNPVNQTTGTNYSDWTMQAMGGLTPEQWAALPREERQRRKAASQPMSAPAAAPMPVQAAAAPTQAAGLPAHPVGNPVNPNTNDPYSTWTMTAMGDLTPEQWAALPREERQRRKAAAQAAPAPSGGGGGGGGIPGGGGGGGVPAGPPPFQQPQPPEQYDPLNGRLLGRSWTPLPTSNGAAPIFKQVSLDPRTNTPWNEFLFGGDKGTTNYNKWTAGYNPQTDPSKFTGAPGADVDPAMAKQMGWIPDVVNPVTHQVTTPGHWQTARGPQAGDDYFRAWQDYRGLMAQGAVPNVDLQSPIGKASFDNWYANRLGQGSDPTIEAMTQAFSDYQQNSTPGQAPGPQNGANQSFLYNPTGQFFGTSFAELTGPQAQAAAAPGTTPAAGTTPTSTNPYVAQADNMLKYFQDIFQKGPQKLGAGSMESMTPTELGVFGSALKRSGINPDDWLQTYKRSRVQNDFDPTRA